jgi:hypothetical protein
VKAAILIVSSLALAKAAAALALAWKAKALAVLDLMKAATASGALLITYSGSSVDLLSLPLKMGPMVTIRPLSLNNSLSFDFWMPTLGDMEVF